MKIKKFIEGYCNKNNMLLYNGKLKKYFWTKIDNFILVDDEPVNTIVVSEISKDNYDILFCFNYNFKEDVKYCYKNLTLKQSENVFKNVLENYIFI